MQAETELENYHGDKISYKFARKSYINAPIEVPKIILKKKLPDQLNKWLSYILPYIRYRLSTIFSDKKTQPESFEDLFKCINP